MPKAKVQRETHITIIARESYVRVWSNDLTFRRKMMKLNIAPQGEMFHLPIEWIQIRPPSKRRFTEAQRDHKRAILAQNIRVHIEQREHKAVA